MSTPETAEGNTATLAALLAYVAEHPPKATTDEASDGPGEPDYCQHLSARCECDVAADIYYGDAQ